MLLALLHCSRKVCAAAAAWASLLQRCAQRSGKHAQADCRLLLDLEDSATRRGCGTAQVAAFLAGLHHSRKFRAALVVCPATVMRQWLRELRAWHPQFRVIVMHESSRAGHHSRPPFRWGIFGRSKEGEPGVEFGFWLCGQLR